MANIVEPKIKPSSDLPHLSINADGTDYKVSVFLFNNDGEIKFVDSNSFNKIVFETVHTTPFLLGTLTVGDEGNMTALNKVDTELSSPLLSEYNSTGDGQEFLRVKISTKTPTKIACQYTDELILDKFFVIKNTRDSVEGNNKLLSYDFVDIVYTKLAYSRKEWHTDLINEYRLNNQQTDRGSTKVNCGRALKSILRLFTEDDNIIDEENWDDGIGKIYYSLPAGTPAYDGISAILDAYVSTDESGGVLTYFNGQFQLQSVRSLINKIYKQTKTNRDALQFITNQTILGDNFGGGIKIQTNDNRQSYTNREAGNIMGNKFNYIPVDNSNITFKEPQPDVTTNALKKKEVVQFDIKTKQMTFHSDKGTLAKVNEGTGLEKLPDGDDVRLNVSENKVFSNDKEKLFVLDDENSVMYYGYIRLQKKLFDSLTKASFDCPGNIEMCANKCLYMNIDLHTKNKFAKKIPGFWYITQNVTTLAKGVFSSSIECVKLDKPK